jgi:GNAT superfamily N-acetyltransferase
MMVGMDVRPLRDEDRPWLHDIVATRWGLPVVSISGIHEPSAYPGFVALDDGNRVGVITYCVRNDGCEVVTLNSMSEGRGVGTALLSAVRAVADENKARLWLITTNDNIRAIRFYQRREMDMVALHRDFVDIVRRAKPDLDTKGHDGIAFRHAIEFSH